MGLVYGETIGGRVFQTYFFRDRFQLLSYRSGLLTFSCIFFIFNGYMISCASEDCHRLGWHQMGLHSVRWFRCISSFIKEKPRTSTFLSEHSYLYYRLTSLSSFFSLFFSTQSASSTLGVLYLGYLFDFASVSATIVISDKIRRLLLWLYCKFTTVVAWKGKETIIHSSAVALYENILMYIYPNLDLQ